MLKEIYNFFKTLNFYGKGEIFIDFQEFSKIYELDRTLPVEERAEWNAIYASLRSESIISGNVHGIEFHTLNLKNPKTGMMKKQELACLIVIKYRVKVIIPESEVWFEPKEGIYRLRSMCGGTIDYVITNIDRKNEIAVASRKLALQKRRFAARNRNPIGKTVDVRIVSVGKNVCTVHYNGYDVELSQRDISYSTVGELREVMSAGDIKKAVVTEWNPKEGKVNVSIKLATRHPFDGIEIRHPIGCTRVATIANKYNGGVFCRLLDGVTDILCNYDALNYDGDFDIGDKVEILIRKHNPEKKLAYGKVLRKMY